MQDMKCGHAHSVLLKIQDIKLLEPRILKSMHVTKRDRYGRLKADLNLKLCLSSSLHEVASETSSEAN